MKFNTIVHGLVMAGAVFSSVSARPIKVDTGVASAQANSNPINNAVRLTTGVAPNGLASVKRSPAGENVGPANVDVQGLGQTVGNTLNAADGTVNSLVGSQSVGNTLGTVTSLVGNVKRSPVEADLGAADVNTDKVGETVAKTVGTAEGAVSNAEAAAGSLAKRSSLVDGVVSNIEHTASGDLGNVEGTTGNVVSGATGNLVRRTNIQCNQQVAKQILTAVEAKVGNGITADIAAMIKEKIAANLNISVDLLDGTIKTGDVQIKAIQQAILTQLPTNLENAINNLLNTDIFGTIEADLNKVLSTVTGSIPEAQLVNTVEGLLNKVVSTVNKLLPKLTAKIQAAVKAELDLSIKNVQVNLPAILKLNVTADVDVEAEVKAAIQVAIKDLDSLDVTATAKAIVDKLQ